MLYGDVRPDLSIFAIDLEPLFEAGVGVRFDRINRALRLANTAIDAFVRVNDEHVLTLIEAVDRANLYTVHVLTFDAAFIDDVGQLSLLPGKSPAKPISIVEFYAHVPWSAASEGVRRITGVATLVQAAYIQDRGLRLVSFDFQRRNERVFSVDNNSVHFAFDPKSDSELRRHFWGSAHRACTGCTL